MAKNKRWQVLLCVFSLVVAMIVTCFAISSCGEDQPVESSSTSNTTEPNPPDRPGTEGQKVSSTAAITEKGDLSGYTSINGVLTLDGSVYLSDETGKTVYKISEEGSVLKKYTSKRQVNRVVTDGTNVYALEGTLEGTVVKLSKDLDVVSEVAVGHTPNDMAVVDGKGYVVNRFSNTVSVVTLADMKVASSVPVQGREPFAAVAVGNDVYVACHLADDPLTESVVSANVNVVSGDKVVKSIPLVNGASSVKGIAVDPDGATVYVTHIVGRYAFPTTQTDRAWVNSNAFTAIDVATQSVSYAALLDGVDHGAANPWGVTVSGDGKYLCVALSGVDEVEVINLTEVAKYVRAVKNKASNKKADSMEDIVNRIAFLEGARNRVKVGKGVRAITEKDGTLYCGLYFDGALAKVTLSNLRVNTVTFAKQAEMTSVRRGQILWTDATVTYQNWESCASCHPEGRCDGLNWDQLSDGIGTPKSSKSPIWSLRTPPATFTGIVPKGEDDAQGSLEARGYLDMDGIRSVFEYMKANMPVESPELNRDGSLSAAALEGKALFETNCASCHPAPLYTDQKLHNVGSGTVKGEDKFDTPSLVECWRSGPYLHDGSLNTLEETVKYFGKNLSDDEVRKVAAFVRSIGIVGETYGVEQVITAHADGNDACNIYTTGAKISAVTVRRQSQQAASSVVVSLSVYDKNGKVVAYTDCYVNDLPYNAVATVTLAEAITLPEGGHYTVSIADASGNAVATPLVIK